MCNNIHARKVPRSVNMLFEAFPYLVPRKIKLQYFKEYDILTEQLFVVSFFKSNQSRVK